MKTRAIIGIDISNDEVRAALVRGSSAGPVLENVASRPLPPNSVDREGLLNPEVLGDAVRGLCSELDPRVNQVAISIGGGNLVARVMEIPPVPDGEIRAVLRGEMEHYRILPTGQNAFDFCRLPSPPPKDDVQAPESVARVLLIGAEERMVASYRSVVDAAGLAVRAVEPASVAVLRALYPQIRDEPAMATVIVSNSATDICITHDGEIQFYRRIDTGVHELRNQRGMAEPSLSANRGLAQTIVPEEDFREYPVAADEEEMRFEAYNRQAVSVLMTEIQRSVDYYVREYPSEEQHVRIRFAIDAPDARALCDTLLQYLRREADLANLSGLPGFAGGVTLDSASGDDLRYVIAVGMALRGAPGAFNGAPDFDLSAGDRIIRERRSAPRAMVVSMSASALLIVGAIVAAIVTGFATAGATRTLEQTKNELKSLVAEHTLRVNQLDRQNQLVNGIHNRDKPMRETIEFLSASISQRACLTSLIINKDGAINLTGETTSPRTVADIMDTINLSPVLDPIRLNSLARKESPTGGGFLRFELQTAYVKKNVDPATAKQTASASTTSGGG